MLFALLSGFFAAMLAPLVCRVAARWSGWLLALVPVVLLGCFARSIGRVAAGESVTESYLWLPQLGVELSFRLDGLSLLFVLLIAGIGALVLIYSGAYLEGRAELGRFFLYLLAFMAAMLGLVLADNGIVLFVFWELTSLTSYFLIGFDHNRMAARQAALQALLVTGFGGLALLAAFLLMGHVAGSFNISDLLLKAESIRSHKLYLPILVLVLLGAFTKSAQTPFHFWLPNAMEAPAPVSAYLHSATMVKAGVYLLARFYPILGRTFLWESVLVPVGGLTMLVGAYLALVHTDMKRILAYTTVSALGLMVAMLGIDVSLSTQAVMVFLLAHALYKGALFLVAGVVDHETGIRDVERVSGLFRVMPIITLAAVLASLSSAGVPPHLGFVGKELIYQTAFADPVRKLLLTALFAANISYVAVALMVGFRPFFGRLRELPTAPHPSPPGLWLGPLTLAGLGLVVGLQPDLVESWLVAPATAVVERQPVEVELALWHGFHPSLLLSLFALLLGIGLFCARGAFRRHLPRFLQPEKWGPARCYDLLLQAMLNLARVLTRSWQSGRLQFYVLTIVITTVALVGASLLDQRLTLGLDRWSDARLYEIILAALILAATVSVVTAKSLINAVVSLGVVGYGVALMFLLFSAPDLAMTQFAIESLSVVLLALVLFRLPEMERYSKPRERLRDALPALVLGGIMTVLVLAVTATPRVARLTPYFAEHTLFEAKGRNVVNVILVDFRGFDTLGEITVLAVAAVGVYSLLKLYLPKPGAKEKD